MMVWQEEHFRQLLTHKKTIDKGMSDDTLTSCVLSTMYMCHVYMFVPQRVSFHEANFSAVIIFQIYFKCSSYKYMLRLSCLVSSIKAAFFQRVHVLHVLDDILKNTDLKGLQKNIWVVQIFAKLSILWSTMIIILLSRKQLSSQTFWKRI